MVVLARSTQLTSCARTMKWVLGIFPDITIPHIATTVHVDRTTFHLVNVRRRTQLGNEDADSNEPAVHSPFRRTYRSLCIDRRCHESPPCSVSAIFVTPRQNKVSNCVCIGAETIHNMNLGLRLWLHKLSIPLAWLGGRINRLGLSLFFSRRWTWIFSFSRWMHVDLVRCLRCRGGNKGRHSTAENMMDTFLVFLFVG